MECRSMIAALSCVDIEILFKGIMLLPPRGTHVPSPGHSISLACTQPALALVFVHLQRLLMRRLGSAQFDSTIACSIMYLCGIGAQSKSSDNINSKTEKGNNDNKTESAKQENSIGDAVENARSAEGSSKPKRQKRAKRSAKAAKEAKEVDGALWSEKQLTSLVWALGHTNQDVLTYTAWTM